MTTVALVAVAAALGAVARYLVHVLIASRFPGGSHWGTWFVNVSGSFGLGALMGLMVTHDLPQGYATVLGTGFLGSYTTFSTWMVESVTLLAHRRLAAASWNVVGSVAVGVLAAAAGVWVAAGG